MHQAVRAAAGLAGGDRGLKPGRTRSLTHTVAGNTLWYGGELAVAVLCALLTSIPVARIIGPVRLSYFTYLQWLTNISGLLAMVGIPMTTRKYMAEYLAQDDRVTAWAIFRNSLRVQMWIVAGLVVAGAAVTARLVKPGYHIIALLMLISVAAKLVVCIPSNANNAAENLRANFFGALAGGVATVAMVNFGLWAGWDLIAVAAAAAIGMLLELAVKWS